MVGSKHNSHDGRAKRVNRREFLLAGAVGAVSLAAGGFGVRRGMAEPVRSGKKRPNFLIIVTDQLGLDAISGHGCCDVQTPNIDRLIGRGVSFMESHSTNPVCSPARSSLFTGRMPVETGVISNNRAIHRDIPNMGQWFRQAGYETVYAGKWHIAQGYPSRIEGFKVLPSGYGEGALVDPAVAHHCETFLNNYSGTDPFLLVGSLLQPHDICFWANRHKQLVPKEPPYPKLTDVFPKLPVNHRSRPAAPKILDEIAFREFDDLQWQYYLYVYYRQVEMVDHFVGRILDALEGSGRADDAVILFTSDHGDGRGRHMHVQKWYPYEESVKVPLVVSWPGHIAENFKDTTHLVSGLDVMSTLCDYAGIECPDHVLGKSLKPLLEKRSVPWRDYVVIETQKIGRTVRTERFKYVQYEGDPVVQLFDMKTDPWEMKNLYNDPQYTDALKSHQRLLAEWNRRVKPISPTPEELYWSKEDWPLRKV